MRYPDFLPEGGTIGMIAPSFGCATEPYLSLYSVAVMRLRDMGYSILEGPNCHLAEGIGKSSTPEKCGAEVNDFFLNRPVDAIMVCGGGETMCEDLPHFDFDAIRNARPLWYMGYSDNTNLTFTLPVLCDTAAIYGPCISAYGPSTVHPSDWEALEILNGKRLSVSNYDKWEIQSLRTDEDPFTPMNPTEPFSMKILLPGANAFSVSDVSLSFSGRLIGGCLDILTLLCGTPYGKASEFAEKYKDDGIIWFMEACDLNPLSIRRALWQMENSGWFKHVRGFLIGRSARFGEEQLGMDTYLAYTGILSKYNVPILMDIDLGHLPPMMPIISGAMADVTAKIKSNVPSLKLDYRLE